MLGNMTGQCSRCGTPGQAVPLNLVRHHLVDPWRGRLEGKEFSFCEAPGCDVAYVAVDGEPITVGDLRHAPAYKTFQADDLLCFCFNVSAADTLGDPDPTPYIRQRVRQGECACDILNPSGACCLGSIGRWKKDHTES